MTEHQHSPAGGGEAMAPDTRVDAQVWIAARNLSEAQREQPEWLWHGANGPASFERWGTQASHAPYVRADIALGLSVPGPAPETITQASLHTAADILAALRIVRDAPPPQYGATPIERWTWDMGWVTRGDWRRGDGRYRLTAAGAAALLVGEMWAGDLGAAPNRAPMPDSDHVRRLELQEVADGTLGDGPMVRGAARELLAKMGPVPATLAAQRPAPAQAPEAAGGAMFPIPPIAERDAELKTLRAQIDAYFSERGAAAPSAAPDLETLAARFTEAFTEACVILDAEFDVPVRLRREDCRQIINLLTAARSAALLPTTGTPPAGAEARREEIARVPCGADGLLARLRSEGWAVAVHNDYRLDGEARTFWLLTHANGTWIKGEGRTDDEALREALDSRFALAPAPSVPEEGWRSIETAPRDATVQIVVRPRGKPATYAVPTAPKTHPAYIDERGQICCPGTWQPDLGLDGPHWQAVLWCPLAAPPVDLDRPSPPASGPAQSPEERS